MTVLELLAAATGGGATTALGRYARDRLRARTVVTRTEAAHARAELEMVPQLLARIEALEARLDREHGDCEKRLDELRDALDDAHTRRQARAVADADDLAKLRGVIEAQGRRIAELEAAQRRPTPVPR
jgi:chromosome segregation ATPase